MTPAHDMLCEQGVQIITLTRSCCVLWALISKEMIAREVLRNCVASRVVPYASVFERHHYIKDQDLFDLVLIGRGRFNP